MGYLIPNHDALLDDLRLRQEELDARTESDSSDSDDAYGDLDAEADCDDSEDE